jgi:hypothetical protein
VKTRGAPAAVESEFDGDAPRDYRWWWLLICPFAGAIAGWRMSRQYDPGLATTWIVGGAILASVGGLIWHIENGRNR